MVAECCDVFGRQGMTLVMPEHGCQNFFTMAFSPPVGRRAAKRPRGSRPIREVGTAEAVP